MNSINTITVAIKNLFVIKHLLLITLICFYTPPSKSATEEELRSLVFSLVVINNEGRIGNGFFIARNLLVTSYEIIKPVPNWYDPTNDVADQLMVERANPENTLMEIVTTSGIDVGEVLITDPENDLAIIKTAESQYNSLTIGSEESIARRSKIFALLNQSEFLDDSTVDVDIIPSSGSIGAQIGNKLFHTPMALLPKSTGAPVFSNDLEVIGVISGPPIRVRTNSHHEYDLHGEYISYTFAVSINRLRNFIAHHKALLERESGADLSYIYAEPELNDVLDMYIRTPEDKFRLSLVYKHGIGGVPKDDQKVFELLKGAAMQGHAEAQYQLGKIFYLEQNMERALYWFNKAANQKHIKAKMQLGHMNANGQGTPKNSEAGIDWLQKALEQEDKLFCDYY